MKGITTAKLKSLYVTVSDKQAGTSKSFTVRGENLTAKGLADALKKAIEARPRRKAS